MTSSHLVLLGDSIFDNGAYVAREQSVRDHLLLTLPSDARTTLLAVDGDVATDVLVQAGKIPIDTTHIALSVGGNDALGSVGSLMAPLSAMPEALDRLLHVQKTFRSVYCRVLDKLQREQLPMAVCTIYDQVPGMDAGLLGALAYYNDVITREAYARRLHLIDLRVLCCDPGDYSDISPIEPSSRGGEKIAKELAQFTLK